MAFKPRTAAEVGTQGVVSPEVLRRQLRQTDLNESDDKGDVALFDVLDNQITLLSQMVADIKARVKVTDRISLTEQVKGLLSPANGGSFSSRYTPTLTDITNVTSSVAYECYYQVIGTTVNVFGTFEVEPTAGGQVELGIELPILSYFIDEGQCAGIASSPANSPENATIIADTVNFRATVDYIASVSGSLEKFWFNFSYQLVAKT